ncbi:MAG: hypothetical protein Q9M28_10465 [Mariprofundaceae bacterium]|nr:hypothetical protein [Mariprofundaceae bacterium]
MATCALVYVTMTRNAPEDIQSFRFHSTPRENFKCALLLIGLGMLLIYIGRYLEIYLASFMFYLMVLTSLIQLYDWYRSYKTNLCTELIVTDKCIQIRYIKSKKEHRYLLNWAFFDRVSIAYKFGQKGFVFHGNFLPLTQWRLQGESTHKKACDYALYQTFEKRCGSIKEQDPPFLFGGW